MDWRHLRPAAGLILLVSGGFAAAQEQTEMTEAEALLVQRRLVLPQVTDRTVADLPGFDRRTLKSFQSAFQLFGKRDSDDDGLKDDEEKALGTNSTRRDTDGDALLDGWEVHGVNGIDLRALGASPLHKDIFVQMDYMERASAADALGPNVAVIAGIVQAFEEAPVANPHGKHGIAIHLITGNKVQYMDDMSPVEDVVQEFKRTSFDAKRAPVFHYMIWANGYNQGRSSGRSMTIPRSDFIVTLGRWNNGARIVAARSGSPACSATASELWSATRWRRLAARFCSEPFHPRSCPW